MASSKDASEASLNLGPRDIPTTSQRGNEDLGGAHVAAPAYSDELSSSWPGRLEDPQPSSKTPVPFDREYLSNPLRPGMGLRKSSTLSINQISQILSDDQIDTDTYGVSELRDGFFDALFLKPSPLATEKLLERCKETLPVEFDKRSPLAPKHFIPRQWHQLKSLGRRVTTTRAGIRLLKSFTAFFAAYALCLVTPVRLWLGRYHYVMVLSAIFNHPARTLGSQLDGTILTIAGTASGLGWGAVGLLLSTSTLAAQAGYGGILALFLAIFVACIAWIRSFFIRFYQAVLCAGIAVMFTTLAETNSHSIAWSKLLSFGVPWVFGQVIALAVNCLVFVNAGARPLATTLHQSFGFMQDALDVPLPRDTRLRRRLAKTFVDLSEAHRDMRIDLTISRFRPDDVRDLRNLMQATIRALLSMETETYLFNDGDPNSEMAIVVEEPEKSHTEDAMDDTPRGGKAATADDANLSRKVTKALAGPTKEVLCCMREGLYRCDATLMDLSGYRGQLGPPPDILSSIAPIQIRIKKAKSAFDAVESTLLDSKSLPSSSIQDPEIVRLFVFARHVRETATTVENLMEKVYEMQLMSDWPRVYLPSYPLQKAIYRTNAQVRHDRGGVAAGSYQVTFDEIAHLLDKIKSKEYKPTSRAGVDDIPEMDAQKVDSHATVDANAASNKTSKKDKMRYKIWRLLYRLQGFESRYALKACLVTTLLSIPSYLDQGEGWWDQYEAWWAVAMSWIVMHPRVGGNLQDLVTRASLAVLGALWSGIAYTAGGGNPYVMAVFATIYMIPMLYRFTQSSHPRSGLVGCISFTVISLSLQANEGGSSPSLLAVHKGLTFLVGTTVPVVVNWLLWPFVARHELRFALSSMLFFMSVIYRNVVAKYVYFQEGKEPTAEDIHKSELLEARIREGFVRMRQLLVLTRHEIRLRASFDPLPYSALADACERFFDYLIAVRQSALLHSASNIRDDPIAAQKLLSYRRDAVAAILANLYILAGALRSQRQVPRYLPSPIAARKKLLVKTAQVEEEMAQSGDETELKAHKTWADIYNYSYNESLTGCVAQLEELEKYTKLIVGQQGLDDEFKDEEEDSDEDQSQ